MEKSSLNNNDRQRIEQEAFKRVENDSSIEPSLHNFAAQQQVKGAEYATIYEREKFIDLINEARIAIIDLMNVANDDEFHTPKAADKGSVFLGKTKLMIMDFEAERSELRNKVIDECVDALFNAGFDPTLADYSKIMFGTLNSLKTK